MTTLMSNQVAEDILRSFLEKEKFDLTPKRKNGETGVDIEATKGKLKYHIECIGYKRHNPARSKDFFQSFFRAISRLNENAEKIVIAMPDLYLKGMSKRIERYKEAWKLIGNTFPQLEIWFINEEEITRMKWNAVYDKYLKN